MKRFLAVTLLLAGCLSFPSEISAAPLPEPLFRGKGEALSGSVKEPTIKRQRVIGIYFNQLGLPINEDEHINIDKKLTLNLFDDVSFQANLNQVEKSKGRSSVIWTGDIEGVSGSKVILVRSGNILSGNISFLDGRIYQIRYQSDGTHVVREIDQRFFPPERDSLDVVSFPEAPVGDRSSSVASSTADSGSTIDVMVVYTASAASAVGGGDAMENLIDLGISETNQGYANSNVIQRLRLVHAEQVNYNENTASPFNDALNAVTNTADGKMDNVLSLRNQYGADLVSLWINNAQYCGLAWQMGTPTSSFESYGYSAVYYNCATGYYSFGHELGHNMGSNHDRANASGPVAYSYSYAYRDPNNQFRTVLAYDCSTSCPRINYYSNPTVLYSGLPTGVDSSSTSSANNALSFNNTRTVVANFRASIAPPNITSLSPTSGYVGQSVILSGSGFTGTTQVLLNGLSTSFAVNSDTQLTAVVPSGASSGPFAVADSLGSANSATFTVTPAPAPSISLSASPSSQTVNIGSSATYTIALNRSNSSNSVTLSLSGAPSGTVASFSPNPTTGTTSTLTLSTTATAPTGTSSMTVAGSANGMTIAPLNLGLTLATQPSTISSFSPGSGKASTTVTITGTGLTGTTSVLFNGAAASFVVLSSTQIQATLPANATSGPITATTPGGAATSSKSFKVRY